MAVDAERQADWTKGGKTRNRIDRPRTGSIVTAGTMGDGISEQSVSVGKQMEMEEGNAIKYRTCSWQKV